MKIALACLVAAFSALALAAELHEGTAGVTVQMTAATLAGDCGGGSPYVPTKSEAPKSKSKLEKSDAHDAAKARRRCEQTSMQLSVASSAGATPTTLRVKKVELFDESGRLVGELTSRTPMVWSETGAYVAWNEAVAAGKTLSVSYSLSEPDWSKVSDRWNKTFSLRAVVSVDGGERTVQRDVTVAAETSLPPGVKT